MKRLSPLIASIWMMLVTSYVQSSEINLLNYNWNYFSGATQTSSGIEITPLGRKIRPKTLNGKWFDNPPINLAGPRLDLSGDFSVTTVLDTSKYPKRNAFMDFYGTIPVCFDETRIDGKMVRFRLRDGVLKIWINMELQNIIKKSLGKIVELNLSRVGDQLKFKVNGEEIGSAKDTVFDKHLFFGVDAEIGGGFKISKLTVKENETTEVSDNFNEIIKTYKPKEDSLRVRAAKLNKPFLIGTAVNAWAMMSDKKYSKVLAEEFNQITTEMDMKFQAIHPLENVYAWGETDLMVEFAKKNNMGVHAHCPVWHEALPEWVWDIYAKGKGDKRHLKKVMLDHITALMTRYKGVIKQWDLFNEIFSHENVIPDASHPFGLRNGSRFEKKISIWYWAMGKDYIIEGIRAARKADPTAELWINDFNIDHASSAQVVDNMVSLIKYLRENGETIDGIGFQAHNYEPIWYPSVAEECLENMKKLTDIGVKVRISELDVANASNNPLLFSDKLEMCLSKENPLCQSFAMWGFTDLYGSMTTIVNEEGRDNLSSPNWGANYADSLIFDLNYVPKSAYYALLEAMK